LIDQPTKQSKKLLDAKKLLNAEKLLDAKKLLGAKKSRMLKSDCKKASLTY
jgi:hypothetical protein